VFNSASKAEQAAVLQAASKAEQALLGRAGRNEY